MVFQVYFKSRKYVVIDAVVHCWLTDSKACAVPTPARVTAATEVPNQSQPGGGADPGTQVPNLGDQ